MSYLKTGKIVEIQKCTGELLLEWQIGNFLFLPNENGEIYDSPNFSFCGGYWHFRVRPNYENSGRVALSLIRNDGGLSRTINIKIGIKGSCGVEMESEFEKMFLNADCWIKRDFALRSELSNQKLKLLQDDKLTVTCEMKIPVYARDAATETDDYLSETLTSGKQSSRKKDVATETDDDLSETLTDGKQSSRKKAVEELQKSLQTLLARGEDSDVLINVQGKEFPAHRAILRARSPVFEAMFAHDMVEKQSGVITMVDCDQETFPDFLEHVYTGSVDIISVSNVFGLYTTSDKYDLSTLKMECSEFLKHNLTVASFCNTITLAIKHSDKDLIERATTFFCANSLEIVERAEWQTFLQENSTVGNELFIKALRCDRNK